MWYNRTGSKTFLIKTFIKTKLKKSDYYQTNIDKYSCTYYNYNIIYTIMITNYRKASLL